MKLLWLIALLAACDSSSPRQSFEASMARDRGTLVDQVNPAQDGVPYFTEKTLNPTWDSKAAIVRIPESLKLIAQDNRERDASMFRGHVSFVAFAFTSCAGFCPSLVKNLSGVAEVLAKTPGVQFVVITVDPETDTPRKLSDYAHEMKLSTPARWTFLTGEKKIIYSLIKDTFVSQAFERPKAMPKRFAHSEHFYVIDGEGRLRGVLSGTRLDTQKAAQEIITKLGLQSDSEVRAQVR